jgi:hypothetical protein
VCAFGIFGLNAGQPVAQIFFRAGRDDGFLIGFFQQIIQHLLHLPGANAGFARLFLYTFPFHSDKKSFTFVSLLGRTLHLPALTVSVAGSPERRIGMFPKTGHKMRFRKVRIKISSKYQFYIR